MLPNDHYGPKIQELDPNELEFVCYGIVRSGSTFVYQLLSSIFPMGIAKTHHFCNHRVKTVVTYRDFRDVSVSMWLKSNSANRHRQMSDREIAGCAISCLKQVAILDQYFDRGYICPLKYEEFLPHPDSIFQTLSRTFDVRVPEDMRKNLLREHSIENNRTIAARFHKFSEFDPRTHIHGNHIYKGAIGGWKEFVDDAGANQLQQLLRPALLRYGYPIV